MVDGAIRIVGFIRSRDKGIWGKLLEKLVDAPDYELLMIDASDIKLHPHAAGAKGGNQEMSCSKRGSVQRYIWPWGCAWYAAPNRYYKWYHGRLRAS